MELFQAILLTIVTASTPLLLAAIGELVVERSGVLNLGVEGMMIIGAAVGFAVGFAADNAFLGVIAAILAGMALSALFAFMTLGLAANQVASGLALTILGVGLSGSDRRGLRRPKAGGDPQAAHPGPVGHSARSGRSSSARTRSSMPRWRSSSACPGSSTGAAAGLRAARGRRQPRLGPCARLSGPALIRFCAILFGGAAPGLPAPICRWPTRRSG